jgi:hypothetical protein
MRKAKTKRILITAFLFLCVLWMATPKVYVHKLFSHQHTTTQSTLETIVQPQAAEETDCDFEKYDTPVYFTLFKFINKFIPLKPREEAFILKPSAKPNNHGVLTGPSRAPPVV